MVLSLLKRKKAGREAGGFSPSSPRSTRRQEDILIVYTAVVGGVAVNKQSITRNGSLTHGGQIAEDRTHLVTRLTLLVVHLFRNQIYRNPAIVSYGLYRAGVVGY